MNNLLTNNRYEIISPLGAGGFAETFLAYDTQMPSLRSVVVKHLKPNRQNGDSTSTELIANLFRKEAAILEELGANCPQIPELYSYFCENNDFYLVQEHIQGKNLAQMGKINSEKAKIILSSLLTTLQYIHSKNIIHRDIKPENIIIRDSDGLPVLIDFGAVKETMGAVTLTSGSTVSSVIVGTRGFMAPEQTAGRAVFSTDLYALGLTMIYALTQKLPIEFSTSLITGNLDWHSHVPNLDPKLAQILDKSIIMDLGGRYPSAIAMYQDLHNMDTGAQGIAPSQVNTVIVGSKAGTKYDQPGENTPVNPPTEVINHQTNQNSNQKPKRWIFGSAMIIILLLTSLSIVGGFFVTRQISEAQQKAAEAEQQRQQAEEKRLEAEAKAAAAEQRRQETERQQAEKERQRLAAQAQQVRQERERLATERKRLESFQRESFRRVSQPVHNISQNEALQIVQSWYEAKPQIFGPSYDLDLVNQLATGNLYYKTTKPDGSVAWLQNNDAYYTYTTSQITGIEEFSNSGTRPYIKVRVFEDLYLHGRRGIDRKNSGPYRGTFTYVFEQENGVWKIYDYKKVR
ncbi:protein kinase domain-containing protein [Anabaena sp. CS-542/02]|uniref:protein kinase domain-containing protein n=1 Tax=Anabaena sp. CS-542/02 TaxID=3021719 RepID=UPI002330A2E3|nr:IMS domain-containing protein [Anabaena sp. CS-542/02]MDB9445482.1 IMS domain-containing protein [Anabaena sp. CS-542/02]